VPKITAISPQKKKSDRFNVFLDEKFAFGIEGETLLGHNLKVGKILSEEEISKIIKKEQGTKLLDLATNFLSYRPRSEKEVRDYLIKKISTRENIKFSEARESPLIDQVISKLKKYKYLDDLEFAKWHVAARTGLRPKGRTIIKLELKKKGISQEIIDQIPAVDETILAKIAIEKKIPRWQNLPSLEYKKKFYQYLASRGFDYDTIKETFAFFSKKR